MRSELRFSGFEIKLKAKRNSAGKAAWIPRQRPQEREREREGERERAREPKGTDGIGLCRNLGLQTV